MVLVVLAAAGDNYHCVGTVCHVIAGVVIVGKPLGYPVVVELYLVVCRLVLVPPCVGYSCWAER